MLKRICCRPTFQQNESHLGIARPRYFLNSGEQKDGETKQEKLKIGFGPVNRCL